MYQCTKPMCTPIKQCCIYTPITLSTQRLFCVHTVSSIYNNPLLTGKIILTFTTGKETCEKHVKIFTSILHVKTCEIYDFICFEVSFTCFNILKNMWKLKNAFEACEIYDFTCFFHMFLKISHGFHPVVFFVLTQDCVSVFVKSVFVG